MASHSVTHASRLRLLARTTPEPICAEPGSVLGHRPAVLGQLAWDSLSYWQRRRLHWKQFLTLLTLSGAGLVLWLYWMSRLA